MTRHLSVFLACLFLVFAPSATSRADSADSIKSGFVYNFSKFVEWPAATLPPGGTLSLCVVGQALDGKLGQLNGRQSQGREIRVRHLGPAGDYSGCHILFIGASEERRVNSVLNAVAGDPVLTISDIGEFAEFGGMIGLGLRNDRVTFTINLASTRAAGLKPSAQLLKLGRVVQ